MHTVREQACRHLLRKLAAGVSDTAASCHCAINTIFPDTVIEGNSDPSLCQSLVKLFRLLCCLPLNGLPTAHSPDTAELSAAFLFHSTLSDGLMGRTAAVCQLRLLTSDPGHNPRLLLRMLLDRDCHLPRILLENACKSFFCLFVCSFVSVLFGRCIEASIIMQGTLVQNGSASFSATLCIPKWSQ